MTSPDSRNPTQQVRGRSDVRGLLSATEALVAGIFSELLGRGDIGPEEDFFDLGGDSLLALCLMEEIAERTGRELPLSVLLERATIRHVASAVDEHGVQPGMWWGINVHGQRRPLFWIYGWSELRSLRNHIDADQPVFQIQDPVGSRWQVPPTVEESARRYVEDLRLIQREGPYQLIGYSFGGLIAYEMAQQLLASGERVNFLGLLDTPAPGYAFPLSVRLRKHKAELRTRTWLGRGAYIGRTVPAIIRQRFLNKLPHHLPVPTPPGSIDRRHYRPNSYPGHIVLFWATEGWTRLNRTPDLGWASLADGGVSVRVLPGRHHTMADGPNARILASHVTECLTQA